MGQGDTALHLAAASGDINTMRRVIDSGCCKVNDVNADGRTPAHLAAIKLTEQSDSSEKERILEGFGFLLKRGASIDLMDNCEKTPRDYLPDW